MNSQDLLNHSAENDHILVPQIVELLDSLGTLAVQVLAAREDLASMPYPEMISKLYTIIDKLHTAYDHCQTNLK